ncbi:MAG TPA: hypothetical protein VD788_07350 [Candidatus Polarisedimenticolaceae bacterium]|nr:hypothetical protein [Candidatus Polarisedimenticolaceae bacterium]
MRKKTAWAVVLILVGLCLAAGTVGAQGTATVKGKAVKVDAKAGTLTVVEEPRAGAEKKESTFRVIADTKIVRDGDPIDLGQVSSGDVVVVVYKVDKGDMVAVSVGVSKAA